jgi:hypothetical protein
MRRPVGVKWVLLFFRGTRFFLPPSRHCRHPSIRTLDERFCSFREHQKRSPPAVDSRTISRFDIPFTRSHDQNAQKEQAEANHRVHVAGIEVLEAIPAVVLKGTFLVVFTVGEEAFLHRLLFPIGFQFLGNFLLVQSLEKQKVGDLLTGAKGQSSSVYA